MCFTDSLKCKVRLWVININSNGSSFYLWSVKIDKCSGSCNNINDPYAKMCVPDVFKRKCQSVKI